MKHQRNMQLFYQSDSIRLKHINPGFVFVLQHSLSSLFEEWHIQTRI